MFGVQFYPTPANLVRMMVDCVDWSRVRMMLEPSAGKGDILDGVKAAGHHCAMECAEIDPDLREVLRGKKYLVAAEDFLSWDAQTRYDLIMMNPPFQNGEYHLLHALDLMQHGGQIVCLLNAATLNNAESPARRDLMQRLEKYKAEIQTIPDAFKHAERAADVDVALIYVTIPKQRQDSYNLDDLRRAADLPPCDVESNQLAFRDPIEALVQRYQMEARIGLKMLDECETLGSMLEGEEESIIRVTVLSAELARAEKGGMDGLKYNSKQNWYIRELRSRYWQTLFGSPQLRALMTQQVQAEWGAKLNALRSYDFTMPNILQIQKDLAANLVQSVDDAILRMFDRLTYENSMEKNGNIHYYNGWKTNKAAKINKKVIVAFYQLYESRWGGSWSTYKADDFLEELEKIFTYLDVGRTDGMNVRSLVRDSVDSSYDGSKIHCKYFDLEFKKKGTVHIFFTNLELLKKLNIFGGRKKQWLPPCYGQKDYNRMDKEEKAVVDAFEGQKSYEQTLSNVQFYLGGGSLLALNE